MVNANFTLPEILYKLLGTNLFPQKNFTKWYKESNSQKVIPEFQKLFL